MSRVGIFSSGLVQEASSLLLIAGRKSTGGLRWKEKALGGGLGGHVAAFAASLAVLGRV